MCDVSGFTEESLRNLLKAQEYPRGSFAIAIEAALLFKCAGKARVA